MIQLDGVKEDIENTGEIRNTGKLRILYYNHSAEVSGAEISLLLTVSNVQGVEKVLVSPEGDLLVRARKQGISVIPVKSFRARMTRNPVVLLKGILGTISAGIELRQIIHKWEPDIIHANSIRAGLIALVGVLGCRTHLIWHVRDNLPTNLVGRFIRFIAARRVDMVFAISNAIKCNFAWSNRLKSKTFVVHNGIDVSQSVGNSIRPELNTPLTSFVVGVVGQIAPWKRQHDAIAAFARFHRRFQSSELWIVGEPKFREENVAYEKKLQELVQQLEITEYVKFLGFRTDIMDIMASLDVLLVPSESEPFGRVVIEAMLAGKPVIGTRGGGIPEIVLDGETGYLVETGDTDAMEQCLQRIYMNRALAKSLGNLARSRALQKFSIQSKVEEIRTLYKSRTVRRLATMGVSMKRKGIVLVAIDVGGIGGMEKHLEELINRLKYDYQVTVLASSFRVRDPSGVRFIKVPSVRKPFPLMIAMFSIIASMRLAFMKNQLVHTTGAIVFNRVDVSTIHFCHAGFVRAVGTDGNLHHSPARRLNSFISMKLKLLSERFCYRSSQTQRLIAVSNRIRQELLESYSYPEQQINVISNGVDIERFHPRTSEEKERLRQEKGLPERGVYLLFMGGDWERKGLRPLLGAFNELARDFVNLHIIVAGGGDIPTFSALVEGEYKDRAHFVGQQSDPENWYGLANVFVFPTQYEACSLAVLEAAASGMAMVVTDVGGARDVLEDRVSGYFVRPASADITVCLRRLLNDPREVEKIGTRVRAHVETMTWDATYQRFQQVYAEFGLLPDGHSHVIEGVSGALAQ